jgi:hypothetical protein
VYVVLPRLWVTLVLWPMLRRHLGHEQRPMRRRDVLWVTLVLWPMRRQHQARRPSLRWVTLVLWPMRRRHQAWTLWLTWLLTWVIRVQ